MRWEVFSPDRLPSLMSCIIDSSQANCVGASASLCKLLTWQNKSNNALTGQKRPSACNLGLFSFYSFAIEYSFNNHLHACVQDNLQHVTQIFSFGRVCFAAKLRKTQVVKLLFYFSLFVSLQNNLRNATLIFPLVVVQLILWSCKSHFYTHIFPLTAATVNFVVM